MTSVESQAGPGGASGAERAAHGPGYGAALVAFVVLVLIAAASMRYMKEREMPIFENSTESATSKLDAVAVMGEKRFTSRAEQFAGADAVGVMGHCILDLRQATLAEGNPEIDAVAVMGQVDIIVPADWIVVPDDVLTVGSLVNQARHSDVAGARTVKLTGAVLMGEIRVRR